MQFMETLHTLTNPFYLDNYFCPTNCDSDCKVTFTNVCNEKLLKG